MHAFLKLTSALFVVANLALPASAATFIASQSGADLFGGNGFATVTIKETTLRPNGIVVTAGGYGLSGMLDGATTSSFTAWSADITRSMKLSSTYSSTTSPFATGLLSSGTVSMVERLFETAYNTLDLTLSADSAGFQLALWEVLYENTSPFSLKDGNFKAWNSHGAIIKAQSLLAGLSGTPTSDYDMTYLLSDDRRWTHYSQNLVTASLAPIAPPSPVPVPAGGALLVSGLAGLAALRRRRKAA